MLLFLEQCLNGLQFGLLLFLLAAGLTLVFGIMDLVNLAHGSLYMMGAYFAATFAAWTGSFVIGAMLALGATLLLGIVLEVVALRRLYGRDHLDHVLGTFGLILFFNELVRLIWGRPGCTRRCRPGSTPRFEILPGVYYPTYRIAIIVTALAVALFLYVLVMRTRLGMLIRAGASNREMVGALGVNIKLLYTLVFGLGAALAGLAGLMQAPILTVQIGMGENILILAFVVIVIGGIGSIRGAFVAAIFVGLVDTLGRAFLPDLLRQILSSSAASTAAPALSSMLIYLLMAIVLVVRPEGLFPVVEQMSALAHAAQLVVAALLDFPRPGAGLCVGAQRQRLSDDAVHPHRHPRAGGGQPQSDPRLWRHDELRPCRLSRHRRLCRRHPGARRASVPASCSGRWRLPPRRCSRSSSARCACARAASISS